MKTSTPELAAVAAAMPARVSGVLLHATDLELAGQDQGEYADFDLYGRLSSAGYVVADVALAGQRESAQNQVRASLAELGELLDELLPGFERVQLEAEYERNF